MYQLCNKGSVYVCFEVAICIVAIHCIYIHLYMHLNYICMCRLYPKCLDLHVQLHMATIDVERFALLNVRGLKSTKIFAQHTFALTWPKLFII